MPAMVLNINKVDITEFHFRLIAQWSILQHALDVTVDFAFSIRIIFDIL